MGAPAHLAQTCCLDATSLTHPTGHLFATPMVQTHVAEARREFDQRIGSINFVANMQKNAVDGQLRASRLRSLAWKMFLGSLSSADTSPTASWLKESARHRAHYDELLSQMLSTPAEQAANAAKPVVLDPLSNAEDSPWQEFFRDSELLDVIKLDLSRTYPDVEFFQLESTQKQMLHILFVWSKLNPQTSYRQGMNELLAPLLLAVSSECVPHTEDNDLFSTIFSERYVEHDTYDLFERIMNKMHAYFVVQPATKRTPGAPIAPSAEPPIVVKCNHIHHSLLSSRDPQLYAHLQSIQILPQLYALRWVRLLCTREFNMESVFVLWDAIFASSEDFVLLDFICVAMVLFVRSFLMDCDNSGALRRLLRYPPVEDVHVLVEKAQRLQNSAIARADYEKMLQTQREQEIQAQAAAAAARAAAIVTQPGGMSGGHHRGGFLADPLNSLKQIGSNLLGASPAADSRPRANNHFFGAPPSSSAPPAPKSVPFAEFSALQDKFYTLETTTTSMSVRLEIICQVLQSNLCAPDLQNLDRNACLQCLAEIKQIKDVLGGRLDPKDIFTATAPVVESTVSKLVNHEEAVPVPVTLTDADLAGCSPTVSAASADFQDQSASSAALESVPTPQPPVVSSARVESLLSALQGRTPGASSIFGDEPVEHAKANLFGDDDVNEIGGTAKTATSAHSSARAGLMKHTKAAPKQANKLFADDDPLGL